MGATRLPSLAAVRRLARALLSDVLFRRYSWMSFRYRRYPRFRPTEVTLGRWRFQVPDVASFLSAFGEIFIEHLYRFESQHPDPLIIDVGANVGVSVLYFKTLFPQSRVIAFEPDPAMFAYLKENLQRNRIDGVELHNSAAWIAAGVLSFAPDGADGGRLLADGTGDSPRVNAIDLPEFLAGRSVDLLKIDIEGAEGLVIPACRDVLGGVARVFVEYHSVDGERQRLPEILEVLQQAGFRLHLQGVHTSPTPLVQRHLNGRFDMQLNIFAWRE